MTYREASLYEQAVASIANALRASGAENESSGPNGRAATWSRNGWLLMLVAKPERTALYATGPRGCIAWCIGGTPEEDDRSAPLSTAVSELRSVMGPAA